MRSQTWIRGLFRPTRPIVTRSAAPRPAAPQAPGRFGPRAVEQLEGREVPAVITVTGAGDAVALDGVVTLREALTAAATNAPAGDAPAGAPGLDTIAFDLPAAARTIAPLTALPTSTEAVLIDGTTQPGYAGAPLVEISGASAGAVDGLTLAAGGSTVRGLSVTGFTAAALSTAAPPSGIRVSGNGTVIEGNWIGLKPDGTALGNGNGVWLLSSGNRVGGATPAARNVISGNSYVIRVGDSGAVANGNEIIGNYIGTDPAGATSFVGTGRTGNFFTGVLLVGANNTVIGRPGAGNVISGGHSDGAINVLGTANGNVIQANSIGLAADGVTPLSNFGAGVSFGSAINNPLNSTLVSNLVGGTGAGEGNRIAGGSFGVLVAADAAGGTSFSPVRASRGISVLGNSIFGTAVAGIGLGGATGVGVVSGSTLPNDPGDADTGANGLQNYPVITSVTPGASSTTVAGTLNSRPNTTYRVELFSSTRVGPGGFGEGRTFLGAVSVTTDGSGNASFSAVVPVVVPVTQPVAATATAPDGSTSAFSLASHGVVVAPPALNSVQPGPVQTTESGGALALTVRLTAAPTADVVVTPVSSDTTEGTVGGPLTFTPANWATPQTVTVTGVNDDLNDGDVFYSVSFGVVSTDERYQGFSLPDYATTNGDDDTIVTTGFVQTSEAGTGGTVVVNNTFTVALGSAPTANVTVDLTGLDATEHSLSASTLTFTPANWNVPQTVTVTGLDDAAADGQVSYSLTPVGASADPRFNGLNGTPVFLSNQDDDLIILSTSSVTVAEGGAPATFTVQLAKAPTQPVTVNLPFSSFLTSFSPSALTFTAANWNVPQTVTVSAPENFFTQGSQPTQLALASGNSFAPVGPDVAFSATEPLTLTVLDNDPGIAAVLATVGGSATSEAGGTVGVSVTLATQPTADVTIPVSSSDTTEGAASVSSLTFTPANWNVPQVVTVTGVNDTLSDGDVIYSLMLGTTTSADAAYAGKSSSLTLVNTDNDPGVRYFQLTPPFTSESPTGSPLTFTVVLTTAPAANVVVPLASSDTTEGTVSPAALTFTPANWNVPQTVTVTGVDDALADGNISYSILVGPLQSTDTAHNGVDPADVSVTNTDDDSPAATAPAILVSALSGQTTEGGGTFAFTVSLATAPFSFGGGPPVTVTVPIASSNPAEGTVSVSSLTFTATDWNVPQTVTVTGVNDAAADGGVYLSVLVGPATSTDFNYSNKRGPDVVVFNADNDAGVLVAPTALTTTEAGGTATFTVVLNTQPAADVTVGLSASNSAEGALSVPSLTFTAANWDVPQAVTVTGVNDTAVDGAVTYTVVTAVSSADPEYSGLAAADVAVTNLDDDAPAPVAISIGDVAGSEGTGGATAFAFTLTLSAASAQPVTVRVNTADGTATAGSDYQALTSATVTFAPGELTATVAVLVTADALDEGAETFTVNLDQPTGATVADAQAVGTVQNDDPAPTVAFVQLASGGAEGAPAALAVTLSAASGRPVTVGYTVAGGTAGGADYTLLGTGTLTFAPGVTTQVVRLAVADDAAAEPDETVVVALSGPTNAALGVRTSHTYTIADNDPAAPAPGPSEGPSAGPVRPVVVATPGGLVQISPTGPAAQTPAANPFAGFGGEVRVAVGDVNGDGTADVLTGVGTGGAGGHVKVRDGATGAELFSFLAFDGFAGGVFVAAGDVDGDGRADLVVAADAGAAPHVKVFSGRDGALLHSFLAYDAAFQGGVRVAVGDVNGDGRADVVTGSGAGAPAHVKVFSGRDQALLASFLAYDPYAGGVAVAVGDLNGDGLADVVTGSGPGTPAHVKVFSGRDQALLASFLAYDPSFQGGVRVGVGAVGGRAAVVTGAGPGAGPHVKAFALEGDVLLSLLVGDPSSPAGVYVG